MNRVLYDHSVERQVKLRRFRDMGVETIIVEALEAAVPSNAALPKTGSQEPKERLRCHSLLDMCVSYVYK